MAARKPGTDEPTHPPLAIEEILACVDSICSSSSFAGSRRLVRFLRFVVEETLRGAADNLNEYSIGVDVYERPESFDPRIDNIVRVEARRLRTKLDEYYRTAGEQDDWIIGLPRGSYRVEFQRRSASGKDQRLGQHFGRYHILSRLEGDEFWTVYRAEDTELNRPVALKIFSQRSTQIDDGVRAEARRAASLSHPNICEVYASGIENGVSYIATAFIEGRTLGERLALGNLPLTGALSIGRQIASAMRAAHENNVLHLDLTPGKVILHEGAGDKLEAKVTGFGRASLTSGDRRADIQAFGAVLQDLVSNGTPGSVPSTLSGVVDGCLSEDDSRRYSDFHQVLLDLEKVRAPAEKPARRWRIWPSLLALAAIAGLLVYQWFRTARVAPTAPPRLVVLPFEDLSSGPGDAGVALAIAESLTGKLARVPGIQVISRTSAEAIKRQGLAIRDIRARLKVDYVLEGSFLRDKDGCRVTVQLIRTADDSHLWSEQYDVPWSNILLVQDEVSTKVLLRMKTPTTAADRDLLDRGGTRNPAALEAYWKGLAEQDRYLTNLDLGVFDACENWLLKALEFDPGYVDAMTELGRLYTRRLYPPRGPRTPWVMKAASVLERALGHEPGNVRANAILGSLYAQEGDIIKGVQYARRSVTQGILDGEALGELAQAYNVGGFYEEALECARQGVKIDPMSLFPNSNVVWQLAKLRRFPEAYAAVRDYRRTGASALLANFWEADILLRQGKPEAVASLFSGPNAEPFPSEEAIRETVFALAAAMQGNLGPARQAVDRFRSQGPRAYDWLLRAAALAGEKDSAIDQIESSTFYRNYRWVVTEPSLRPFRKDPRFQDLVRRLYDEWQRNLAALRDGLHYPPPVLTTPDQYFSAD
jgi:TolB-like protein/tetratricopeptide (TPR) repeat protein/tRNA A-37 threonylcarbamoyl transferase component Bud32